MISRAKPLSVLLVLVLCLFALLSSAHAGTKVINVELGVSTLEQVRKEAASVGRIQNAGTSTWSKGPILLIDNPDLGIEGVKSVQYIFDPAGKLSAVVMTMPSSKGMGDLEKRRFDEVAKLLAKKNTRSPRRSAPLLATATPSSQHPTPPSRSTHPTCPSTWKCAT